MKLKPKYRFKYHSGLIIAVSAVVAGLVVILLSSQVGPFKAFIREIMKAREPSDDDVTRFFLYILTGIGILVFVLMFSMLFGLKVRYIREITRGVDQISKGDLTTRLPVVGDNELSYMAAALNTMAEDIQTLIAQEHATEKSKNELITNVAHDLRTPLTSILGYLELLEQKKDLPPEVKEKYIAVATGKAKKLQNLIEELFGFTKMSYGGKLSLKVSRFNLVTLLEQLLDEFYPVFENNQMVLEFHTNENNIMINGDSELLARLFDNLINNAVKYGAAGKLLTVNVMYAEPEVTVEVTNFSQVISPEQIEHIFDKFYRVDSSRPSQSGGTGLGLAIVKEVAQLHGGSVSCKSDTEGTTFTVKLLTDSKAGT